MLRTEAQSGLVNDREIKVHTRREIQDKRRELQRYIWGEGGFPKELPVHVVKGVGTPVKELTNLKRVDEFRIPLAEGVEGLAYHFVPERSNRQLVIVHHGHACTLDDAVGAADVGYGLQRTIAGLLHEGYGVLGVFMPRMRPGDCTGKHEELFQIKAEGSPLKFFLEPTAASLNYLKKNSAKGDFPRYREFHMAGLSGGGWTTTVYAAVDPTIRCSFPVAGSIPLYLRSGSSIGDREQFEPSFYELAGYPDLYILGAYGRGRQQVQILIRKDDCCFGEAQHDAVMATLPYEEAMREYEGRVRSTLHKVGAGSFQLAFDETAPGHMISYYAIERLILPTLAK